MRKLAIPLLGLVFVAGCAVGPNYKKPEVPAPDQYREVQGPPAPAELLADRPWWEVFGDAQLQRLIDEALQTGYDVRIAAWRVEEARARAGIARSEFWPQISYGGRVVPGAQLRLRPSVLHGNEKSERHQRELRMGARPLGTHPAAERGGQGAVPRDGGSAPRRPPLARLGRGAHLLSDPGARRGARDRQEHGDGLPGDRRPLRAQARAGRGLGARDLVRHGGPQPGRRAGALDRAGDRGGGESVEPPPGPQPGVHPPRPGARGPAAPAGGAGRASVGSSRAAARHPPERTDADRRQRHGGRRDGELLPPHQPDGRLRRRRPRARQLLLSRGKDLVDRRRPLGPALPGRPAPQRVRRVLRAVGAGAALLRADA